MKHSQNPEASASKVQLPETPEGILGLVGDAAQNEGVKVYAVGGYIRDRLLGRDFHGEIDFSVVGDAPAFARTIAKRWRLSGKVVVYRRFGTARIEAGGMILEFATSRSESYPEDSRKPIVEPAPFDKDLARRDFTVNALAVDTTTPEKIIDKFNGLADLDMRLIRTPLAPEETFSDDPLRILRAIRFAAQLAFNIEADTFKALGRQKERLCIVARERINEEFFKILTAEPPSHGLRLLLESGVLEVVFPEIAALAGVEQVGRHHHKDVFAHTLKVLDKMSEKTGRLEVLLAALLHDVGKPDTKHFDRKSGWTFHGHEHVGERMVKRFAKRYRLPEETVQSAARLVRLHMRPMNLQDEGVTDSAIRRLVVQADNQIDDLLTLCRADITSSNPKKVKRYLAEFDRMVERMDEIKLRDSLKAFQSPIRGEEIIERLGIEPGPRIGLIKALLEEAILEGEVPYSRAGAESLFDKVAGKVAALEDGEVLRHLRAIMKARSEGLGPPPEAS